MPIVRVDLEVDGRGEVKVRIVKGKLVAPPAAKKGAADGGR